MEIKIKTDKVNIKTVAQKANVTAKTISNYLNKTAPVKKETAEKIRIAIEELNYAPNRAARILRTGKTRMIGFTVDISNLNHPATMESISKIEEVLSKTIYNLYIISLEDKPNSTHKLIESVNEKTIDGLILGKLSKKSFEYIEKTNIPKIFTNKINVNAESSYTIINNVFGAKLAANYLLEKNHKNIGIIVNESSLNNDFIERRNSFVNTIEKNRLKIRTELKIALNLNEIENNLENNKEKILNKNITAFFVTTDITALYLISFLHKNKIRIPEDISIIGFDNINYSKISIPSLTTVGGFIEGWQLSIDNLIHKIEKGEFLKRKIVIKPKLFIRDSVKTL